MTKTYPLPVPRYYNRGSRTYYDHLRSHELRIPQCTSCERFTFPPQLMCPRCHGMDWEWTEVPRRGVVHTFTVVHGFEPRAVPMFSWPPEEYPIIVVVVELEGPGRPKIVTNLRDGDLDDLAVGVAVDIEFHDVSDDLTLPVARVRGTAQAS